MVVIAENIGYNDCFMHSSVYYIVGDAFKMILICMFTSIFNSFSFVDQSGVILVISCCWYPSSRHLPPKLETPGNMLKLGLLAN